ncbi:uncharacterized protein LOC133187262 [Saccostrea echinata]|uniref:uncharacterized protein LOC133187262 n=1 Tax=Saccostrea echinata TaxID=191078 RepID=UPI002A82B369|nr:uncharacterized protein LOC133187262 [Saccostrea echinata]
MKQFIGNQGFRRLLHILTGSHLTFYMMHRAATTLEIPNLDDYSTSQLLQNSSVASTEAASTLLTYVTMALFNAEKEYVKGVYLLIKLMEVRLENPGHPDQDKMDELIIESRISVKALRKKRQDLVMLLSVCQRLVNDAAEAAYMAGAEFSGYSTNNKLTSSEAFLKPCEMERLMAESHLAEMEARVIEVESKRAKEEEARDKQEEEVKDDAAPEIKITEEKVTVQSEPEVVSGTTFDLPPTDGTPVADNSSAASPNVRMNYVETFNIGSEDDSLDDD